MQLHKYGHAVTVFSKNGADFTRRFPSIAAAIVGLPTRPCIIDGELIAADASGQPDFRALLYGRTQGACVYAFDLMELQGRDLRDKPLAEQRARLKSLLARADSRVIRFCESFPDADALLAVCARRSLEGIVSKRKDSQYRSGPRSGWLKVKTQVWKDANKDRWRIFEKGGGRHRLLFDLARFSASNTAVMRHERCEPRILLRHFTFSPEAELEGSLWGSSGRVCRTTRPD